MKLISLAQGSGGIESNKLINELFFSRFKNDILLKTEDAAVFSGFSSTAFTTDSFIVNPIFFAGGNIGKLSVCGTCNDLAMMAAKPTYLSLSVIIEEGFSYEDLEKIADSIAHELSVNGACIVTGDTKIAPRGSVDKIFINTTGVGEVLRGGISCTKLQEGDKIIVSRSVGEHGAAIFCAREQMGLDSDILRSDCASLWPSIEKILSSSAEIIALRDATRGGIAAVLNEWCHASHISIHAIEDAFTVLPQVRGVCELLGFEPLSLANEGTFVAAVRNGAEEIVDILKTFPHTKDAAIVGEVVHDGKMRVVLENSYKTKRILEYPSGELLPRIC